MWFQLYGFVNLRRYIIHEFILDVWKDDRAGESTRTKAHTHIFPAVWTLFSCILVNCGSCVILFIYMGINNRAWDIVYKLNVPHVVNILLIIWQGIKFEFISICIFFQLYSHDSASFSVESLQDRCRISTENYVFYAFCSAAHIFFRGKRNQPCIFSQQQRV